MKKPLRQRSLAGFDGPSEDPPDAGGKDRAQPTAVSPSGSGMKQSAEDSDVSEDAEPSNAAVETPASGRSTSSSRSTNEELPSNGPLSDGASSAEPSRDETIGEGEWLKGRSVYVVDAHSLIYQVFHAMPDMSGPSGQPVGALHGFTRDVLELIQNRQPDYLICAFDHSEVTFRNEKFADYKAEREAMPADLKSQIPPIHRMLEAMKVPALETPGFEADDILATLARLVAEAGGTCFLVTSDKDCRQLLSPQVHMYNMRKNAVFDEAALLADWGVRADQVVDFQALVGDPVDNVPGVPLIGPKLARDLLNQHETLDNVLDRADQVSGKKRRENLIKFREQALLSRELVKLVDDVPFDVDWSAARVGGVDGPAVAALCDEFGFRRLGERLGELSESKAPAEWSSDYRCVESEDELRSIVEEMRRQPRLAVDTETTSTAPRQAEIVGYSFCWEEGRGYYVPVRAPEGQPQLDPKTALELLRPVFEDPGIEKVGQNLKYDMIVLRSAGVALQGLAFDTMVADYLLAPGERNHSLDDLSQRYLDHATISIRDLIGSGKQQKRMDEVDVTLVTQYAVEDVDVPWRLAEVLQSRLEDDQLGELFRDLEMPLIEVLADLEFQGIRVDVDHLKRLGEDFTERMDELRAEIFELAGVEFRIESPKQLAEVMFDKLKLRVIKRTKSGPSTDADVLQQLAAEHPLPERIVAYRQYAKLRSTYVNALQELVHPETGRVHTSFKQDVAATGRLSSSEPNLQNIPVRTEVGRQIRAAFLPGPSGWSLVAADYSQIELRVLAHFSGDPALIAAFREDRDVHAQVASEVFGVTLEEVTAEMRRQAKAVNFGVIYGQSPFGLARALNIDKDEAAAFIEAYFERYQGVEAFIQKTLADCRRKGYVSTILGRRRAVQGVRDPSKRGDSRQRTLPERIAINTVIQGTAADLIKQAMIRVHRSLERQSLQTRMLLQIHDELIFESPPDELSDVAVLVQDEMAAAVQLSVPLKIDLKSGDNWAACEPLK